MLPPKKSVSALLLTGSLAMLPGANCAQADSWLDLNETTPFEFNIAGETTPIALPNGFTKRYLSETFTHKRRKVLMLAIASVGVGGPLNQEGGSVINCMGQYPGHLSVWLMDVKSGKAIGNLGLFVFALKAKSGKIVLMNDVATDICGDTGVTLAFTKDFESMKLQLNREAAQLFRIPSGTTFSAE